MAYGPGVKKIRDCFALLTLENYVSHFPVVFGMGEHGCSVHVLRIEVAETDFQGSEEKILPIPETFAVLAYRGAPIVCDLRQAHGAGFQLDQIVQSAWDEFTLGLGANDC